MAPYASVQELKTWMLGSQGPIDTWDDTELSIVLDAATREIDRITGRHFTLESAATKYFYPTEGGRLQVVDLNSITSISIDTHGDLTYSTTLSSTDYELLPLLDEVGQPATRFDEIRIWPLSSRAFSLGRRVRIVGNWGWATVPAEVKQACLILASRFWKRRETPLGILGATDIGQYERISKNDPDVDRLLSGYKRTGASWVLV